MRCFSCSASCSAGCSCSAAGTPEDGNLLRLHVALRPRQVCVKSRDRGAFAWPKNVGLPKHTFRNCGKRTFFGQVKARRQRLFTHTWRGRSASWSRSRFPSSGVPAPLQHQPALQLALHEEQRGAADPSAVSPTGVDLESLQAALVSAASGPERAVAGQQQRRGCLHSSARQNATAHRAPYSVPSCLHPSGSSCAPPGLHHEASSKLVVEAQHVVQPSRSLCHGGSGKRGKGPGSVAGEWLLGPGRHGAGAGRSRGGAVQPGSSEGLHSCRDPATCPLRGDSSTHQCGLQALQVHASGRDGAGVGSSSGGRCGIGALCCPRWTGGVAASHGSGHLQNITAAPFCMRASPF